MKKMIFSARDGLLTDFDPLSDLKNKKMWVVWRKEQSKTNGRIDKIPYYARTHKMGFTDERQLVTYIEAKESQIKGKYDGVGLCFNNSGYTFIDIDHCIDENGNYNRLSQELIDMFRDCYIEKSQSKHGMHIIAKGEAPSNAKINDIGLEIYINKYCAITEDIINARSPNEATERITSLYSRYRGIEAPKKPLEKPQRAKKRIKTDKSQEIIEEIKKSKYAEKFYSLHNTGDYKGQYLTPSQGAQAYINLLWRFTSDIDCIIEIVNGGYFKNTKHADASYIIRATQKAESWINGQHPNKMCFWGKLDEPQPQRKATMEKNHLTT